MNRSALMAAGDKQKHLDKLEVLKCDIATVNLEDGVGDKDLARSLAVQKLRELKDKEIHAKTVVRVNDLKECGKEDIHALNSVQPHAIRIPKVLSIDDVKTALDLIDDRIEVHLSIETKEALYSIQELKIDKRVTTVYLGILDMLESFKLSQSLLDINNPTIDYILSKYLIDSLACDLTPIFFTYQDFRDTEGFEVWCQKAKLMGFQGTSCISPGQVEIANRIFAPDKEAIERAKNIKEMFEHQKSTNKITGFSDEKYGFIDEPIYKDALNILKFAEE